jgi:hypothetical protein
VAIVRELVTRLGFTFDRSNLDKFERSIIGFKTKVAVAVGTIGFAFKKVLDYANDFSDKVLKNSALAKFAKTSANELEALQNVFQKFNVPTEVFQGFFGQLTLGIKEASRGVDNEFRRLVTQSQGAVRLFVNGQLTTSKQAIDDIMAYLRSIADESEKLRIVQKIFGVDVATAEAITNIANLTKAEFNSLIEQEKRSVEQLDNAKKAAVEFKKQVNQLGVEWNKFSDNVAAFAIPFLNKSLGGINVIAEEAKSGGFVGAAKFVHAAIEDFFAGFRGEDYLSKVKREVAADEQDFRRRLTEYQQGTMNTQANVTNNNKFEFNVPPGTTEQQATFLTEAVKTTMSSFWDEKVREVINNNPQVE